MINSILKGQIDYVRNSNISVDIDRRLGCVLIYDNECELFLQGDDGINFIDEVDTLVGEYENLTYEEAYALAAYPYADLLPESPRL